MIIFFQKASVLIILLQSAFSQLWHIFFGLWQGKHGIFEMVPLTLSDYFVYFFRLIYPFIPSIIFLLISLLYKLTFGEMLYNKLIEPSEKDSKFIHTFNKIGSILGFCLGLFLLIWGSSKKDITYIIIGLTLITLVPIYKITASLILKNRPKSSNVLVIYFFVQTIFLGFFWGLISTNIAKSENYEISFTDGKIYHPQKILPFSQGILIENENANQFIPWTEIASIALKS